MKKIQLKKCAALLIAVTIGLIAPAEASDYGQQGYNILTRGDAAAIITGAADDYASYTRPVMTGDENGSLRVNEPVTRAEALIMISRAFGDLPAPVGNDSRIYPRGVTFEDVPLWATDYVCNLTDAGVLLPSDDNILQSNEYATEDWVMTVLRRIWALIGSNLRDDYYSCVNKSELDESSIPTGSTSSGTFSRLSATNNSRISSAIKEIIQGQWQQGSSEQKIKDFYLNSINVKARNEQGILPILPYLREIDEAKSVEDLMEVRAHVLSDTGLSLLVRFDIMTDPRDSSKYALVMLSKEPNMPASTYKSEDEAKIYIDYLAKLTEIMGSTPRSARRQAEEYFAYERKLSESMLKVWEYSDIDKTDNRMNISDIEKLSDGINVSRLIADSGYILADNIIIPDMGLFETCLSLMKDEYLSILKTSCKLDIAMTFGNTLCSSFDEAKDTFTREYYGMSGSKSSEDKAIAMLESAMPVYTGKLYADRYFSPEAKADVTRMAERLLSTYKERLNNLQWMSAETKERAARKLDSMTVKIGYPDSWSCSADNASIRSFENGGSLFENTCQLMKAANSQSASMQFKPVDKSMWSMSVFTVNAYYNPAANEIVFPAGILQPPFYDVNATEEENMGGIGFIIAHEITHSFDNNGAKFDENGNACDWWTDEDYRNFSDLCTKAEKFFDGIESAPGIYNDGKLTLSENIADLGSMACILDAVKGSADYDRLFRKMASCWEISSTPNYLEYLSQNDVHSAAKLRVNRIVVNFPEFYKTYDIGPGDGMYVAPDERIVIW